NNDVDDGYGIDGGNIDDWQGRG
ncbi:unnamed protein product, partial [Adineta steineri]